MPVNTPSTAVAEMLPQWQLLHDVLAPRRVKAAGAKYLPKLRSHEKNADLYKGYVMRAVFQPVTARTKRAFEGLAFRTPPAVEVPNPDVLRDVTGSGVSFEAFARMIFGRVVCPGRVGILTDMAPESPRVMGAARPFLSYYDATNILDVRKEPLEVLAERVPVEALVAETGFGEGDQVPTVVRLLEWVELPSPMDPYLTIRSEQVRVISLQDVGGTIGQVHQLFRPEVDSTGKPMPSGWAPFGDPIVPTRRGVPVPFLPFVVINQEACGAAIEEPAFLGLAEINLSQYRTSADLENSRFKLGHPQLCVWGVEPDTELLIGDGVWSSQRSDVKAEVLQVADAFAGLERAMAEKDQQMLAEGARLMAHQGQAETATAARIRAVGERSLLRGMVETASEGLTRALAYLVWWQQGAGTMREVNEQVRVALNSQFEDQFVTAADAEGWLRTQLGGGISRRTLRHILRQGGVYPDDWSDEQESAAIAVDRASAMVDVDPNDAEDNGAVIQ